MSYFQNIEPTPEDPVFGRVAHYKKNPRIDKAIFILGYFLDKNYHVPVLETVSKVEKKLAVDRKSKEYLPIEGDQEFTSEIGKLIFGSGYNSENICGIQTVGGTGALYLAATLAKHWTGRIAYSQPTWINHHEIFKTAELITETYPYYQDKKIHFEWMVDKLKTFPEKTVVLLQTNCHNPSGFDLTKEEWKILSDLFHKHHLFPLFDMAYQGLSNTPEEDAYAPRLFMKEGHEMMLAYTSAKSFSMYSERAGALFVIANSSKKIGAVLNQLKIVARGTYSNPPSHGSSIIKSILKDPLLKEEWLNELSQMRERIQNIRKEFVEALYLEDPNGDWEFVRKGKGLFCLCEMGPDSVKWLRDVKGYYTAENGRINITGLNQKNLKPFVKALVEVQKKNRPLA